MIRRLLIANRGEIAVRIIKACRELGVESVAVYSDADAGRLHVVEADRAIHIGPAAASESYLSVRNIIDAARQSGADAVHPGYGFLAEQPALAEACETAGLVFVGPPSAVIAKMGSKIEARRTMQDAGVPTVPGEVPADQSDEGLRKAVERVGFPALIKASAGGGGKGMRVVRSAGDVADSVASARRESMAAFGDGTLYVERQLQQPHHVEVQVFGDRTGRAIHLFERECSVQRRHQKIIEESPSPSISPELRSLICEAAVRAARAASYENAGTVEFLVEHEKHGNDAFYFLEMNTRLQVEHPVTEFVAGVDMVQAQILVASGESLPWSDSQLSQRGHAIEARVYAEDPSRDFLPQAGRLLLYREPRIPGVRIDSGVREGDVVTVDYDPLLAKVVAHAETRSLATARLTAALRDFPILGIRTNIPFLLKVLTHERFAAGTIDTRFLDGEGAALAKPQDADDVVPEIVAAAVAAHGAERHAPAAAAPSSWDPWLKLRGWR